MVHETQQPEIQLVPYSAEPMRTALAVSRLKRTLLRGWLSLRRSCSRDPVAQALLERAFAERLRVELELRKGDGAHRYRVSAPVAARLVVLRRVSAPPTSKTTWLDAALRGYDAVLAYGLAERLEAQLLIEEGIFPRVEILSIEYPRDILSVG